MATSPKPGITSENPEQLTRAMHAARAKNDEYYREFIEEDRAEKIDSDEDEIINNYINAKDILLGGTADPIQIQKVLSNSQNYLSRVTEIYAVASKRANKLRAARNMLHNTLLSLVQGSSADARLAKVNDLTQGINYMIDLEDGLINICETAMKNLRNAQDMASRTLKAIELDLVHFNGSESLSKIVQNTRSKYYDMGAN